MTLFQLVSDVLSVQYEKRLLIFDTKDFRKTYDYTKILSEQSFFVVIYDDIEAFRLLFEKEITPSDTKWAVIVSDSSYVPYDIRKEFYEVPISLKTVFPKLDEDVLGEHLTDLDIIGFTYQEVYSKKITTRETEQFLEEIVFATDNVKRYLEFCRLEITAFLSSREGSLNYIEWIEIAIRKATIEEYAARVGLMADLTFVDEAFSSFVLGDYSTLSGLVNSAMPTILPKVMDYIAKDKVALIIMDGMSLFDFNILSRFFDGIEYDLQCSYALIPSTTSISRQSLLSGKYPRELGNPFSLSKEEKGFYDAAAERGYTGQQTEYTRGYEVQPGPFTKFLAVIINEIDDIVHGQRQGRLGMYNDITLLGESGKLQTLIRTLHSNGFTVYVTSDHGNTLCHGIGGIRNTGVEVETKAKRMLILKDFADVGQVVEDSTIEFPAYYLDKKYRYLICKTGVSFDVKNSQVMTHGGISIDEVIVPFVRIKAVQ
jgi:hypothetical protein